MSSQTMLQPTAADKGDLGNGFVLYMVKNAVFWAISKCFFHFFLLLPNDSVLFMV